MKTPVFGTIFTDWLASKLANDTEVFSPSETSDLLYDLPGGLETATKAKILKNKAERLLRSIPKKNHHEPYAIEVSTVHLELDRYLSAQSGKQSFYIKSLAPSSARLLPTKDFLMELHKKVMEADSQLNKLEITILILKKSGFKAFDPKWLDLSTPIKRSLQQEGHSPSHLRNVTQLSLKFDAPDKAYSNRLKGIDALKELSILEIVGEIACENEFNELASLPHLRILKIGKGPKCMWPNEDLFIKKFPKLSQLTIKHAKRFEDYQVAFRLETLEELTLMDFAPQNLKDIITIRSLEQLRKINIHFSTDFDLSSCANPLIRNLIKHYQKYTSVKLYPAELPNH
ncbi:hypothetical protein FKX85_12675 [Echinicola soli]|uniref:Uncharacterized protein n=1 Tax=Echinicola soli TaxID=2591634 RepID=A0A514CJ40_9BACT|nr:hypothetical protein [Echinicola soli]QDH79841.1 hypothetical protein FKX85_12675 [Echinicola soli]